MLTTGTVIRLGFGFGLGLGIGIGLKLGWGIGFGFGLWFGWKSSCHIYLFPGDCNPRALLILCLVLSLLCTLYLLRLFYIFINYTSVS